MPPLAGLSPALSPSKRITLAHAIVRIGGKQYRVQEGERLLVDRLKLEEGKTFQPDVLFADSDGVQVTVRVLGERLGKKIRIGKYKAKKGYKRHTGFRAKLTQVEIESIGGANGAKRSTAAAAPAKAEAAEKPAAATPEVAAPAAADDHVKGMPQGYEDLKVAEIAEAAPGWNRPMLEAALEYEQAHGKRKGAIAAIESALATKEDAT
jgi:large subunit ribosomal protein L21